MTVAILASRKGYLKVLASVVQAACARGHRVVLLRDPGEQKPGEAVTDADLALWPTAAVRVVRRGEPLLPLLRDEGVDALVGASLYTILSAMGAEGEAAAMRAAGIRLYSVDYVFDTAWSTADAYRTVDVTCYMSEYQRRLHWELMADGFAAIGPEAELRARSVVIGSTMLDQLARVDRAAVRRKYGLPDGRPVVLFMSLKMAVPEPLRRNLWAGGGRGWRALVACARGRADLVPAILRGNAYRDLVGAVHRFCRRAGATLVVKSRAKNADPRFLRRRAGRFFVGRDGDVFPYTSIELMAVADLCVHFQSGAVFEAVMAGVPSLSVRVSQSHLAAYESADAFFNVRPGSFQNFAGVVWSAGSPEEAARHLAGARLEDFRMDPAARRAYVETFMGFDDARSSERLLDLVEDGVRLRERGRPAATPRA